MRYKFEVGEDVVTMTASEAETIERQIGRHYATVNVPVDMRKWFGSAGVIVETDTFCDRPIYRVLFCDELSQVKWWFHEEWLIRGNTFSEENNELDEFFSQLST